MNNDLKLISKENIKKECSLLASNIPPKIAR